MEPQQSPAFPDSLPRLAVGIAARNDAPRLDAAICEARRLTEHVFVIDADSTDNSRLIAERHGVSVVTAVWNNDYAEIRNQLLRHVEATGVADWLLWLHPGERFDAATRAEFDLFFRRELEADQSYIMVVHRCFYDTLEYGRFLAGDPLEHHKHERDEEAIELRLLPLHRNLYYTGRVRESVFSSLAGIGISGAPGRIQIARSLDDHREQAYQARENLAILDVMEKEGVAITDELLLCRALALMDRQKFEAARADFRRVLRESPHRNLQLEALYRINESYAISPPIGEEQTEFLSESLQLFQLDFQLLTSLGLHMQRQKRHDLAIRALETALNFGQVAFDVWHRRHIREIAALALSSSYRLIGNHRLAAETLELNLDKIEDRQSLALRLLDVYIATGRENKAQQLAATIWGAGTLDAMRDVITGACRASAGAWDAAILPLESVYLAGCRLPLCLRWYALSLLVMRKFDEAIPVLDEWCQAEPKNIEPRSFRFAAQDPEKFSETLEEIRQSQMESLGLEKPELLMPVPNKAIPIRERSREIALAILGAEAADEKPLEHAEALREIIELSDSVPLPYVEGVAFNPDTPVTFR